MNGYWLPGSLGSMTMRATATTLFANSGQTSKSATGAVTADRIAETANSAAAILSTGRRPMRSLSGPDSIIASVAVSDRDDTDQPSWILVSENSTSIKRTTPEITDASKPIRKPPSATNNAIVAV